MPNPSWPAALPSYVLEQGFSEGVADQLLETQMDAGPAKRRRRYTRNNRTFTVSIAMTEDQSEIFEQFYDTTLKGGSLAFDWVHPRMQSLMTYMFRHPVPKISEIKGEMRVWSMAIEAQTDPLYVVITPPPPPPPPPPPGTAASFVELYATRTAMAGRTGPYVGNVVALSEAGREGHFVVDLASNWTAAITADTAQGIFVISTADATKVYRRIIAVPSAKWFGATGNGTTNDSAAFVAALACLKALAVNAADSNTYKSSGMLFVPFGHYYMGTTTLDITHTLIIEGEGGMGFGSAGMGTACRMRWDAGATGIRVQAYNTSGASTVDGSPHFSGAFTTINNISLEGPVADNGLLSLHGLVEGEFHGIHAKSLVQLNNCIVAGFQGDGLYSHTTAGGGSPDEGASNASRAYNCWFTANRNGVSLGGADSNVWTFIGCQATFNRACGVDDSAFLTNTHIGWHTSGNGGYLDNDGTANFPAYTVADGGSHYSVIQGQETNASTNRPKTSAVTITIASPGVVSWTAHGLPEGTLVTFSTTGALPTGLAANTSYYVVNPNANDFQLANTRGGTAINTSGSQSGTHRAGAALDNAYWYYVRAGGVDLSSGVPAWSSGIHLRVAAPIRTPETSAGTVIINFYAEQNQGCIQAGNSTIMIGGTIPVPVKGSVSWQRNVSGFLTLPKLNVTDFMSSIAQNIQLGPQYDAPVSDTDVRWHTTDTNITMQWQSWSALAPRTEYTLTINKNNGVVSTARVAHYFKVTGSSYNWEILLGAGTVGFFGSFGAGRQTVTGSRGGNAALADLLTKLANLGIITDGTT